MQEWQRIKDDKLRAEQEAEAAHRAAAEEAGMYELSFFRSPIHALTAFSTWFIQLTHRVTKGIEEETACSEGQEQTRCVLQQSEY